MGKKLSYEEKFNRFKERLREDAVKDFFSNYLTFKEIEEGLVKEKKKEFEE